MSTDLMIIQKRFTILIDNDIPQGIFMNSIIGNKMFFYIYPFSLEHNFLFAL